MLGERLASARKRMGLSQRQLAAAMGERFDQTMISRAETGRSGFAVDSLSKASAVLGVSIDYLFGLTDDPTPANDLVKASGALNSQTPDVTMVPKVAAIVGQNRGEVGYDATVLERLPLPSRWLSERGIDPDKCHLVSVKGNLMAPTLPDGCTILVDLDSQEFRENGIFVLQFQQQVIERTLKYLTPVRLILEKGIWEGKEYEDWYVHFDGNGGSRWPLQIYDFKGVIGEVVMVVTFP